MMGPTDAVESLKIVVDPQDTATNGDQSRVHSGEATAVASPFDKRTGITLWKVAGDGVRAQLRAKKQAEADDDVAHLDGSTGAQASKKKTPEELMLQSVSAFKQTRTVSAVIKRAQSMAAVKAREAQMAAAPSLVSATKVRMFAGGRRSKTAISSWRQASRQQGMWVILDADPWYQAWFILTVIAAAVQAWTTTYMLAFVGQAGWSYPTWDNYTVFYFFVMLIFVADIVLNFFVSKIVGNRRVTDPYEIKMIYLKGMFWVDFISVFPFDAIVLRATGWQTGTYEAGWSDLLALITLLRMHRMLKFFHYLEINIAVSHLTITLVRNFIYVFYVVHWAACAFYYIARQQRFASGSWVGQNSLFFDGLGTFESYLIAVYWSMVTFATVGYGDIRAYTVPEAVFVFCYIGLDIALGAYIIGTITLLVVRHDEKTKTFRDTMTNLQAYCQDTHIDEDLRDDIHTYLELQMGRKVTDETITQGLPAALRRRVLRSVYRETLDTCYLFKPFRNQPFPQKFLDALLASSHVEVFLPMVDIITDMEIVNELYIVCSGSVGVYRRLTAGKDEETLQLDSHNASVYGGARGGKKLLKQESMKDVSARSGTEFLGGSAIHELGEGCPFGEVAFFTHQPSRQVFKAGVDGGCKALVINRDQYYAICADYPRAARLVLENLQRRVWQTMRLYRVSMRSMSSMDPDAPDEEWDDAAEMDEVKFAVERLLREHTERNTNSFLYAASQGNFFAVKTMVEKGHNVNATDYDGRSALMLAAGKGHANVVLHLLDKGANWAARDNFGCTALSEAVDKGQATVVDVLIRKGARLIMSEDKLAGRLCQLVQQQAQAELKHYFRAKADPNAADYDNRTALHIATAEGNLSMVKLLVKVGADMRIKDRWGATPLDEALRVGAMPVVEFLEQQLPADVVVESRAKLQGQLTKDMLTACAEGEASKVKRLLDAHCPVDIADYDHRTGLMLSAGAGHLEVVQLLLKHHANPSTRDNLGGSALMEACKHKRSEVVKELTAVNAELGLDEHELASLLCNCVYKKDYDLLELLLLAGANPDVTDYDKRTALHIAAAEGNLRMVTLLTSANASFVLKDRWGQTALDEAVSFKQQQVVDHLKAIKPVPRKVLEGSHGGAAQ